MEVYWKLASLDASAREAASVELVRDLLTQEEEGNLKQNQGQKPDKKKDKKTTEKHVKENIEMQEDKGTPNRKRKGIPDINDTVEEEVENATHNTEDTLLGATVEDDDLQNCSPSVRYALRRLVQGVASSRECARQGFAMALASMLEALPWVKVVSVLKLIRKNLEVTSSMKGQEKRDGLLGQLFALGAVIRSGRLVAGDAHGENATLARDITEQLLTLAKRKAFLREPAINVLLQFLEKLQPGDLQDGVLSSLLMQETLCVDMEAANADTLLLALKVRERLPSSIVESCPLLPNSSSARALFEPSHLLSLVPVLKDSSSCHPRVHPIWSILIELLFKESNGQELSTSKKKQKKTDGIEVVKTIEQRVASFWTLVVDNSLLTSSHERKYLCMELLQLVLPKLAAQSANLVLSKTLVRCLLDILATKGNRLYKSGQLCLDFICEWAKADEQRTVEVIVSLQHGSHGKFDKLSKTQTVKNLIASLKSKEGCFLLYNKLIGIFNGDKNASFRVPANLLSICPVQHLGDEKEKEKSRFWILEQMYSFIKQIGEPEIQLSLWKKALAFFTINALFLGASGSICHVQELHEELQFPELPVSDNIRKLCLARLQGLLVNASPTSFAVKDKESDGKSETTRKTFDSVDLRFFFLELCDMLDKVSTVSRIQPVSEGDDNTISTLRSCISQLKSVVSKVDTERSLKVRGMCSLLMQILLQSITTGVTDVTSELVFCCERAFGDLIEVDASANVEEEKGDMPAFMDVLVDILLSLLAQSSAPIRAAAEQVFKLFCSDMTESAMLSLLRVVKQQLKSGRRVAATALDVSDSDEDDQILEVEDSDEDMEDIDDNEDNGRKEDDDKGGDDGIDADESKGKKIHTPGSDSNKGFKAKEAVDKANGVHMTLKGTPDSKDNSDSDLDMDDEAMFRIDVHLANLLKQRGVTSDKGEGKDAQTQLLHFKFRVLSLVEYFFQKRASSPLCLNALPYLLRAFVLSSSWGSNAQLGERISSVLLRLSKSKEYPKGTQVDKQAVAGLLQLCMKLASRSKGKKVRQVAQSCSLWLVKVLHGQQTQDSEDTESLVKIVHEALNEFFSQKKSHFKSPFFRELFMRFPEFGTASLGLLLDRCKNARSEYLQHEALLLVNSILQLHTGKDSKQFRECLVQHLPALSEVMVSLIEKVPSKAARKLESRRLCVSLLKAVATEFPEKSVKKLIGKQAYKFCLSHFGESIIEGMTKSKGMSAVLESPDYGGADKKRLRQKSRQK